MKIKFTRDYMYNPYADDPDNGTVRIAFKKDQEYAVGHARMTHAAADAAIAAGAAVEVSEKAAAAEEKDAKQPRK